MSSHKISSLVTNTVTLGGSAYGSPLTISAFGTVAPGSGSSDGIIIPAGAAYTLLNNGVVDAGAGNTGTAGAPAYVGGLFGGSAGGPGGVGYSGGTAVFIAARSNFTNTHDVTGGAGGKGGAGGNGKGSYGAAALAGYGGNGGAGGAGVNLVSGGVLTNSGIIDGGAGGAGGKGGSSALGGPARSGYGGAGGTGVILGNAAVLTNTKLIAGGQGGANGGHGGAGVYVDGGTLITSGTINGGAAGSGGAVGAAIEFGSLSSLLILDPGAKFSGAVAAASTAHDTLEFSGTSTSALDVIGSEFTNFKSLSFANGASWTIGGSVLGLASGETIAGFSKANEIDLTNFKATSRTFVTGKGLVLSNASSAVTLDITGNLTTAEFTIASDGGQGTLIKDPDVTCFARGTRVATAQGEIPVEDLAIGMKVKTLHAGLQPIKWIGQRSYAAPFANHAKVLPVLIRANAIAPGVPCRDLQVSPGHAICLNGQLVHASRLVNGVTIEQLPKVERISYFHVELDSHEVIFAENCPAETFRGEVFRGQFENAAAFKTLYPGDAAPEAPCLPELRQGFALHALRARLAARAGIAKPGQRIGQLRGFIEYVDPRVLIGWAQDMAAPEQPVVLELYAGETRAGRIIANLTRDDLRDALGGSGAHGFEIALPPDLPGPVSVRRSLDQARLAPLSLQAAAA